MSSSSAFFPHHGFKLTTSRFSRLQNTFQTKFWVLSITCDICHSAGQAVCLNPAVPCGLPCRDNSCPCRGQLICWDDFYSFLFSLPTPPPCLKWCSSWRIHVTVRGEVAPCFAGSSWCDPVCSRQNKTTNQHSSLHPHLLFLKEHNVQ